MKKTYTLKGLTCPNCAANIERSVLALEGVHSATVNPMTAVLNVQFGELIAGEITRLIENIVRIHEPDVQVVDQSVKVPAKKTEFAKKTRTKKKSSNL